MLLGLRMNVKFPIIFDLEESEEKTDGEVMIISTSAARCIETEDVHPFDQHGLNAEFDYP